MMGSSAIINKIRSILDPSCRIWNFNRLDISIPTGIPRKSKASYTNGELIAIYCKRSIIALVAPHVSKVVDEIPWSRKGANGRFVVNDPWRAGKIGNRINGKQ